MQKNITYRQRDIIENITQALQYISYYHSADFIKAISAAHEREKNIPAKNALAQVLISSKMSATGKRPICQDTGIVNVFVEVGMNVSWDADMSLEDMINEGVRRAYTFENNPLRASVVSDPLFSRKNTRDNTPAVIYTSVVPGNRLSFTVAAKGLALRIKQNLPF